MDTVLQGISGVAGYINDILISINNERQHLQILGKLVETLEEHGFWLKEDRCVFLTHSVENVGQFIDQEGIYPLPSEVTATVQAPTPTKLKELWSFLGLLNYYGKLILKLATTVHPLKELLQAD